MQSSLQGHPDGGIFEINDGFTAITGYTPEEVLGKTTAELSIWRSQKTEHFW